MRVLQEKILSEGKILPGGVLKVDGFLNHMIDVPFLNELCSEFYRRFRESGVTKILTVEASGIAIASLTALQFNVPMLFAKKSKSKNISSDVYTARVKSFTHDNVNDIHVSKEYLSEKDKVLIVDDFLAHGEALNGLISIVKQSGAALAGAGIVIEKGFQNGGDMIRAQGVRVESLAIIEAFEGNTLRFR